MSPVRAKNPVALFFGLLALTGVVAGLTFGGVLAFRAIRDRNTFDPGVGGAPVGAPTAPGDTTAPPRLPAEGQLLVTGTVTAGHVDRAQLEPLGTPLEIVTPERGGGAGGTFRHVIVDGEESTVVWDAGRPLELAGDRGQLWLEPPRALKFDGRRITVELDGTHTFTVGGYRINTPVAIGSAGLSRPVDSIAFEATGESRLILQGDSGTSIQPHDFVIKGPGRLTLEGDLQVTKPDGDTAKTGKVEFEGGPYEITVHLADGGYTIEALLQGDAKT